MLKLRIAFVSAIAVMLAAGVSLAGPVNVNTADAETISAELKGVGITKAIAIVEFRKANGPFRKAEDLAQVKGIGTRTVEINKANIKLASTEARSK